MCEEENNGLRKSIVTIIIYLVVITVACFTIDNLVKQAKREVSEKVNEQWMQELDKRGLIIRNDKGGFQWKH